LNVDQKATKEEIRKAYRKVLRILARLVITRLSTYSWKSNSNVGFFSQAALLHHPDKAAEGQRQEAEVRFKAVSEAYEILYDDQKRHLYDVHGMSAFNGSNPGMAGGQPDLDDLLASMFGMDMGGGMGGMPGFGGPGGPGGRAARPRKGQPVEQKYEVSLEDLYKGRTVKFASTKNVVCNHCKGKGGKEKATPKKCSACNGLGKCTPQPQNKDIS
jgi:DnaJ family protein A protein 2